MDSNMMNGLWMVYVFFFVLGFFVGGVLVYALVAVL